MSVAHSSSKSIDTRSHGWGAKEERVMKKSGTIALAALAVVGIVDAADHGQRPQ